MGISEIAQGIRKHLDRIANEPTFRGDVVVEERYGMKLSQTVIKGDEDSVKAGTEWLLDSLLAREARGDSISEDEMDVLIYRLTRDITNGDEEAARRLITSRRKSIKYSI